MRGISLTPDALIGASLAVATPFTDDAVARAGAASRSAGEGLDARLVVDRGRFRLDVSLTAAPGDVVALLGGRWVAESPALAPLYQIPASEGWMEYEFPPDSPRQGLLTHVSFVALRAHPGRSSPTLRGKALRERLLCQEVPPPPPNVDFGKLKARLAAANPPCCTTWTK